jgi:uncharacterized membrane protein
MIKIHNKFIFSKALNLHTKGTLQIKISESHNSKKLKNIGYILGMTLLCLEVDIESRY